MAILNGLAFLIPLLCAFSWGEPAYLYFGPSMAVTLALGGLMMGFGRRHSKQLGVAGGAWYMVLVWVMLGGVGMLPYLFSGSLSVADAFFESISAYTTVGLSCAVGQAGDVPRSLVLWHGLMEWLGGLNFILLMVTIIPQVSGCFWPDLVGASEHQLQPHAGAHGYCGPPGREDIRGHYGPVRPGLFAGWAIPVRRLYKRLPQHIDERRRALSFMSGGNPALEWACAFSMLLACGNFLLYWKSFERRDLKSAFQDTELRVFLGVLLGTALLVSFHLWKMGVYDRADSLRLGFFHVLSFL